MPPKQTSGSVSRSVHHGNMMNKKGSSSVYQKSSETSSLQMKLRPRPAPVVLVEKKTKDIKDVTSKEKNTKEFKRQTKINENRLANTENSESAAN